MQQLTRNTAYSLCECFVLEWCIVDLDDTLIFLKETLSFGTTVFLNSFNMKAQGSCNTRALWLGIHGGKHIYNYVPVPEFFMCFCAST